MSTPHLLPSTRPKRKKPSPDGASFEELLEAHRTERTPGQLPREGVVLIGVDLELQRDMAASAAFSAGAPKTSAQNSSATNIGAPNNSAPDNTAINFGAPEFNEAPDFDLDALLVRRTLTKTYPIHDVSRIEDVFTSNEKELLKWLWENARDRKSV